VRSRYREEWTADLAGAPEAGARPSSIVAGALALAATIDRDDPAVSGMPRSALAVRRARWAAAFLGTGLVLLVALYLHGGWADHYLTADSPLFVFALLSRALEAGAPVAIAIGALLLIAAVRTALPWRRPLGLLAGMAVAGAAALAVLLAGSLVAMLFLPVLGVAAWGVVALMVPAPPPADPRRARRRELAAAAVLAPAVVALAAFGVLHIMVWNPLAKLPGLGLDEIYAGLAAAGELPSPLYLTAWVVGAVLAATAILLFATLPHRRLRAARSPQRVLVLGLTALAGTGFSMWLAGFGMGMGIADAFATSGGDAAFSALLPVVVGVLAGVPAVLLGCVPGPRPVPAAS